MITIRDKISELLDPENIERLHNSYICLRDCEWTKSTIQSQTIMLVRRLARSPPAYAMRSCLGIGLPYLYVCAINPSYLLTLLLGLPSHLGSRYRPCNSGLKSTESEFVFAARSVAMTWMNLTVIIDKRKDFSLCIYEFFLLYFKLV